MLLEICIRYISIKKIANPQRVNQKMCQKQERSTSKEAESGA